MMPRGLSIYVVGLFLTVCAAVGAQNQGQLTARELFYTPVAAPQPKTAPVAPKPPTGPVNPPTAGGSSPAPAIRKVDYRPLGLRYSILKRVGDRYAETDVDTTFRSGDSIRVSIESNDDAFLYIVNKGTSGTWNVLFPSVDIDNGNNRVPAQRRIEVPGKGQFTFDDRPGVERLFIVLSRDAEPDLERLIYSLGKPESAQPSSDQRKFLTVNLNDDVIDRVRASVNARDLVFEKVNDDNSVRSEKAAYIVNANATGNGAKRVVADLSLKHESGPAR